MKLLGAVLPPRIELKRTLLAQQTPHREYYALHESVVELILLQ